MDDEKKILNETYYPKWSASCKNGDAISCRFASYIAKANDDKDTSKSLEKLGCTQGDYTSCCGLICNKEAEANDIKKHEELTLKACRTKDYSACLQHIENWKDDNSSTRRSEYSEVLKILCDGGDRLSCEDLIWEKYRI